MGQESEQPKPAAKISPSLAILIFVAFPFGATGMAPALLPEWEQRFGTLGLGAIAAVAGTLAGFAVLGLILLVSRMVHSRNT